MIYYIQAQCFHYETAVIPAFFGGLPHNPQGPTTQAHVADRAYG